MKQRLLAISAATSLLFCILLLVWSFRGLRWVDHLTWHSPPYFLLCSSSDGLIRAQLYSASPLPSSIDWRVTDARLGQWQPTWGWPRHSFLNQIGFGLESTTDNFEWIIPFWFLCLVTAILPAIWLRPWWWNRASLPAIHWLIARPWRQYPYARWLCRTALVIAVIALLAAMIFWIRSYQSSDSIVLTWTRQYRISWQAGSVYFERRVIVMLPQHFRPQPWEAPYSDRPALGFETGKSAYAGFVTTPYNPVWPTWGPFTACPGMINGWSTCSSKIFAMPAYALVILLSLWPLWCLLTRSKRHPKSHCQSCGYNLSGNPSAPTCPECGRTTPQSISALSSGPKASPNS